MSLSIAIVDDPTIAELHQRYMGLPGPTDVLSFDLADRPGGAIEGEVVASADTAAAQAAHRGLPHRQELLRYVIHGTLHLTGMADHTPAGRKAMRAREDQVLAAIGELEPGLRPTRQRSGRKSAPREARPS